MKVLLAGWLFMVIVSFAGSIAVIKLADVSLVLAAVPAVGAISAIAFGLPKFLDWIDP